MLLRSAKGLLTVKSQVPYSACITEWLYLRNAPLSRLEGPCRWFERQFLAWETVRRVRNPFFVVGTGFEGYFISQCATSDEMIDRLLEIGREMLASQARLYRNNVRFRSRLMAVLVDERNDADAVADWSALLGATLARVRCSAGNGPQAAAFQSETYRMTNMLPGIRYQAQPRDIMQTYTLPSATRERTLKLNISPNAFRPCDQDAALVVWQVGRMGHPLVRQFVSERSRSPW